MEQTILDIAHYAASKGKDITAEDLDFRKAKARSEKGYSKDMVFLCYSISYVTVIDSSSIIKGNLIREPLPIPGPGLL